MSFSIAKIIQDQVDEQISSSSPLDNALSNLVSESSSASVVPAPVESSMESTLASNDYDTILNEIQSHEMAMETAVRNADEISGALKDSIMFYLNIRSANRNGILYQGVPEVLQASARLLDISISGRYKIANLKKMRASIIKDKNSGNSSNSNELNLAVLLSDN